MDADSIRRYISLAMAGALLVTLHLFRPTTSMYWLETFFDWLHVPVFALVAIGVFHAFGSWRSNVNKAVLAFLATIALGLASEAAQIPTSRDASWSDILSNTLGAAIGLLAIPTASKRTGVKIFGRIAAVAILVVSCKPLIEVARAYAERDRVFPVILNGTWPTDPQFMSRRGMAIDFRNLYPDWREFKTLFLEIEVRSEADFPMVIRVHDKEHLKGSQPTDDRFNRDFLLEPGLSVIEIALSDIELAPAHRRLDLSRIDGLVVFSTADPDQHRVQLRKIWLE